MSGACQNNLKALFLCYLQRYFNLKTKHITTCKDSDVNIQSHFNQNECFLLFDK